MKRLLVLLLSAFVLWGCSKQEAAQPKSAASSAASNDKVILSTTVAPNSDYRMSISFDPSHPKMSSKTKFHLQLLDARGIPENDGHGQCALVMPLMDMGKNEFPMYLVGKGGYEGIGQFTMSGEWEVVCSMSGPKPASPKGKELSGKTTFNVRVED